MRGLMGSEGLGIGTDFSLRSESELMSIGGVTGVRLGEAGVLDLADALASGWADLTRFWVLGGRGLVVEEARERGVANCWPMGEEKLGVAAGASLLGL